MPIRVPYRMPPPLTRRIASVLATLKPVRGRGANAVRLPLRRRATVVRFAWRYGIRRPGSVWDRRLREPEQHVAVHSR